MKNQLNDRVAELSATLKPITEYGEQCSYITGDMREQAEDENSYNSSFYCDGWVKPVFEGGFKGIMLQKVEEFQVLREYFIWTRLEGYSYDEIPEEEEGWEGLEYHEMEITDTTEVRQYWISKDQVIVRNVEEADDGFEAFVVCVDSVQDWIFEPKHREYITKIVNQFKSFCYNDCTNLAWFLSPCSELLLKNAPEFAKCVQSCDCIKDADNLYRSLKIAIRHKFALPTNIQMTRMYLDYLNMASLNGLDMTNPKFVCPTDIASAHDRMLAIRNKKKVEEEKRKARAKEQAFADSHSWAFGIHFDNGHFQFQSLDSVEAFRVEGEIMHHCVYRCAYYEKPNCITFHVSDMEGNRVATTTVDVVAQKIIELQTICNNAEWRKGEEYKEIQNLLLARMRYLPKPNKKTRKQKTKKLQIAV